MPAFSFIRYIYAVIQHTHFALIISSSSLFKSPTSPFLSLPSRDKLILETIRYLLTTDL